MSRLIFAIGVCILALPDFGCRADRGHEPQRASSPDTKPTAAPEATAAPPVDPRKARFEAALRGLRFEGNMVRVDQRESEAVRNSGQYEDGQLAYDAGMRSLKSNVALAAVETFARAILASPEEARLYEALGLALQHKRDMKRAAAAFRTALALDPERTTARYNLGFALQAQGQHDKAIETWHSLVRRQPRHALAHRRMAIACYYTNDYPSAWSHAHRAEALGTEMPSQFLELLRDQMPEPTRTEEPD